MPGPVPPRLLCSPTAAAAVALGGCAAAWRHVHDIFTRSGVDSVQWVWTPNVPYYGSTPLGGLYSGADYVDVTAMDGYNRGTSQAWSSWQQPWELFAYGPSEMRRLAPGKEIVIAETATAEAGGSKAEWNTHPVHYLAQRPDVTGTSGSTSTRRWTGGSTPPPHRLSPWWPSSPSDPCS